MKFTALFALLLANSAFANGLDDLKLALAPLQGQGALHGTYESKTQRTEMDGKVVKSSENGAVSAQVEDDVNGFLIRWDHALMKRAADEAKPVAKGAKKVQALTHLIESSSAPAVAQTLNYAPKLLQYLANSQLRSERADTYQGKPARLIEVNIVPPEEDEPKVSIKENSHVAQIWLGADGLPLSATVKHSVKASMMLVLSFEQASKEEFTFSVVANRLVIVKRDEQGSAKGFGNDSQYRNSVVFTPKA